MEWLYFAIILITGFYSSNESSFAPQEKYFYGLGGSPEICKPISELEANEKNFTKQGKFASYSNKGQSICRKNIFEPGERDEKIDLITSAVKYATSHIASKVDSLIDKEHGESDLIFVNTSDVEDQKLARYLQHVFTESLASSKKSQVIRHKVSGIDYRELNISIANTIFVEDVIQAKISKRTKLNAAIEDWIIL